MESGYSSRPCKQAKQKAGHLAAAGLDSRAQQNLLVGGLTHLEAGETDDRDFFADLGLGGGDEVLNLLVGIAEVSLFEEAGFGEELVHATGDDLLHIGELTLLAAFGGDDLLLAYGDTLLEFRNGFGVVRSLLLNELALVVLDDTLGFVDGLIGFGLRELGGDFALLGDDVGGDLVAADETSVIGDDLHRELAGQFGDFRVSGGSLGLRPSSRRTAIFAPVWT